MKEYLHLKAKWWVLSRLVKLYNHLRESKDIEGVSPLSKAPN